MTEVKDSEQFKIWKRHIETCSECKQSPYVLNICETARALYNDVKQIIRAEIDYKLKTHRTNSFPGDTNILINAHLSDDRIIPIMGVCPKSDRTGRYYQSDRFSNRFKTITDAKQWIITHSIVDKIMMG